MLSFYFILISEKTELGLLCFSLRGVDIVTSLSRNFSLQSRFISLNVLLWIFIWNTNVLMPNVSEASRHGCRWQGELSKRRCSLSTRRDKQLPYGEAVSENWWCYKGHLRNYDSRVYPGSSLRRIESLRGPSLYYTGESWRIIILQLF